MAKQHFNNEAEKWEKTMWMERSNQRYYSKPGITGVALFAF